AEKVAAHPRLSNIVHWGADWSRIDAALEASGADVVGISAMFSCYYTAAYEVARRARRALPSATIVLGGPHATSMPEHVLGEPAVDLVVLGEAETRIAGILGAIRDGGDLRSLEGLAFRCDGRFCSCTGDDRVGIHVRQQQTWLMELDTLDYPAADLLDFAAYGPRTTLITSRGCPFSCSFCSVHATVGKRFRARSPEKVVDEIEWYIDTHGVTNFSIEDDNFTFDMDRVLAICREVTRRGLRIGLSLPNGITVLKLTPEVVRTMVRAGFSELFLGLETTDPERLKKIRKGFASLEKANTGVDAFRDLGVEAQVSLIVGLPGQRPSDVATDVIALLLREMRMSPSAYYPVVGAPDYTKYLEAGFKTDPALLEGYGFNATSSMSSDEMYWTWIATMSCGMFGDIVLQARRELLAGRSMDAADVINAAIAKIKGSSEAWQTGFSMGHRSATTGPRDGIAAAADHGFDLDRAICICGAQNLSAGNRDTVHAGTCDMFGDYVAMAAALGTGLPITATEILCSVDGTSSTCRFALALDDTVRETVDTFCAALDAGLTGGVQEGSAAPSLTNVKMHASGTRSD
ncbi:MAG: anaerobic magnesium-protoporphyrin monomethyl ester cyclase, partial [Actinomycetota bacterium]